MRRLTIGDSFTKVKVVFRAVIKFAVLFYAKSPACEIFGN